MQIFFFSFFFSFFFTSDKQEQMQSVGKSSDNVQMACEDIY